MPSNPANGQRVIQLKNQIVEHFSESQWRELGMLTDCYELVDNHGRLLRSLSWGDPDYEGNVLDVLQSIVRRNPANLDLVSDYVRKAVGDLVEVENVSSEEVPGKNIVFTPSVFSVPLEEVNRNLVSVMMPFDAAFSDVFRSIYAAARQSRLECKRADDIWEHSVVIQDVFSLIYRSFIVICDFTGKNPNVFYEAGIAHTLGKHVIPITQSADDIPFDIRHHRFLKYLNNSEGRSKLTEDLASRIATLVAKRDA